VSIQVVTNNRAGILADISQTLSSQRLNISEANCRASDDGRAVNVFSFRCGDLSHLKNVMKAITKIQGVVSVDRV
jgi:GTP pyrophosphokinase